MWGRSSLVQPVWPPIPHQGQRSGGRRKTLFFSVLFQTGRPGEFCYPWIERKAHLTWCPTVRFSPCMESAHLAHKPTSNTECVFPNLKMPFRTFFFAWFPKMKELRRNSKDMSLNRDQICFAFCFSPTSVQLVSWLALIPMHSPSRLRMSSYKSPPSRPFFLANPSPCHTSNLGLTRKEFWFSPPEICISRKYGCSLQLPFFVINLER